ncbi:TrmB family transcriptional regulator [Thermococcus sp.]
MEMVGMAVVDEDTIERLKLLGLREYEARVYATLAVLGPSKASEIAKESGVPRPRVYDVLKELHRKGFVDVREGNPTYFKAVEPEKAIASLRDEFIKSTEELIIKLKSYRREQTGEWSPIWYLQGEWNIRNKVDGLAERSEKELVAAFASGKLALKFKKALEMAGQSGVDVKVLLFGEGGRHLNALSRFGDVTCIKLEEVLKEEQEDFGEVVAEALFSTRSPYRVKGLFVRDGEESILLYEEGGILKGLIITIPFIPVFQRKMLIHLIEKSREKANAGS